jgi:hypothetical protein
MPPEVVSAKVTAPLRGTVAFAPVTVAVNTTCWFTCQVPLVKPSVVVVLAAVAVAGNAEEGLMA